ncbi:hypothetical protein MMB75_25540 [Paenibacillus sp. P2(2022)]|uniref:hypothetical protein n=1 Tax=Paenibacillus TaxID=44249 RepID=UPI002404E9D1|nr:hypothetical protein [Paenibacillus sp. P2(2022)]MDG0056993.1 hypothetical protein [Paenibacillus sp. P2(2022)]MEE4577863.1 hypothetical protein [Paenibacillus polymyxa]
MADNQETETETTPAAAPTKKEAATSTASVEPRFAKEQFQDSQQFTNIEKDFLSALLQDKRTYTVSEAKNLLADFNAKEAK